VFCDELGRVAVRANRRRKGFGTAGDATGPWETAPCACGAR